MTHMFRDVVLGRGSKRMSARRAYVPIAGLRAYCGQGVAVGQHR